MEVEVQQLQNVFDLVAADLALFKAVARGMAPSVLRFGGRRRTSP